jgi:E3 ubiquitin-protein ligase SHPRH
MSRTAPTWATIITFHSVPIVADELQRFAFGVTPAEPAPPIILSANGESVPRSRRRIDYNLIPSTLYEDIKTIECFGSYGSKIETIIRHLLHIQLTDPGAKSISAQSMQKAFADALTLF